METFNLLSIGQRAVGKTVFLAGSYAELHSDNRSDPSQPLWFDGQDKQDQENLETILNYVSRVGQYPPPTMRITDFNLSLKRRNLGRTETLCHFRWWDIPGESCNLQNPDFQKLVLTSHGCCVFINADALVHDKTYLQPLEEVVKQVVAIASLVNQHRLWYAFALIFTRCDLIEPGPIGLLQIEENLQPLITRLDAVKAKYQRFYSAIPIVRTEKGLTLGASGAAAPLLWLTSELRKLYSFQPRQDLASGLSKPAGKVSLIHKVLSLNPLPITRRYSLPLILAGVGLLGVIASLLAFSRPTLSPEQTQAPEKQIKKYEQVLQREPNNFDALFNLANLYIQRGQPNEAVPLMEKLIQQNPKNLDLRLNLAQLYELTGQNHQAETAYDQILVQQESNFTALISKAILRSKQGDTKMARTLFVRAERVAPSDLKAKVRALAQSTLPSASK